MGEKTVVFKFEPGQIVMTPLGGKGIVDVCALEVDSVKYYVINSENKGVWMAEKLLTEV